MARRRGFTLVEVLIALVVMGVVTGAIYRMLNLNQRVAQAQAEQVSLQSNVRTGSLIVPSELRELNTVLGSAFAAQSDVRVANANAIEYRAMRGLGILCQASTANEVRIRSGAAWWTGTRNPEPGRDSLYLFVDGDVNDDDDDGWVRLGITAVNPNSNCGVGVPAFSLSVAPAPVEAVAVPVGVPPGSPVRLYERMRMELKQDAGQWWLAAGSLTPTNQATQPVLGPLRANDGFQLEYLNSAGNVTAALDAITSIRITVRGLTDDAVREYGTGALARGNETLATQVFLRNSIRP
jgi:prepilin-type N-terminal cleavage/methylation domain-containing protein